MSAPDVNLERQKNRHRTMVRGLWIGVAIAGAVAVCVYVYSTVSDAESAAVVMPSALGMV